DRPGRAAAVAARALPAPARHGQGPDPQPALAVQPAVVQALPRLQHGAPDPAAEAARRGLRRPRHPRADARLAGPGPPPADVDLVSPQGLREQPARARGPRL